MAGEIHVPPVDIGGLRRGRKEGEDAEAPAAAAPPPPQSSGVSKKVNKASKKFFVKLCHPISAELSQAIVVPALQFTDRQVEQQFAKEHFMSVRRITYTVLFGFFLITLQIWFGLYKGWLGINQIREELASSTTSTAPAAYLTYAAGLEPLVPPHEPAWLSLVDDNLSIFSEFDPAQQRRLAPPRRLAASRRLAEHPRCLWGREEKTVPLRADAALFEAACINQSVADAIILLLWWVFSSLKKYSRRLENIAVLVQITRVVLIILFAQGMWSDCARNQGPTDVMMNNIAVASANITFFNCVPLARVRRGFSITLIFLVGVLEIIIVMTQGSTGGVAMSPHDAAQLTMYIMIFVLVPSASLLGRYRAEMSEREAFFLKRQFDHVAQENRQLKLELDDMNKVRSMDIEKSLPEGLVPSQIVHVAVRELQQAERSSDQLQRALPSIFLQQTKHTRTRDQHAATSDSTRITAARQIGLMMEYASDLRASVQSALKLLCRSHDLYSPAVQGNYAGALMFHAIGHGNNLVMPTANATGNAGQTEDSSSKANEVFNNSIELSNEILLHDFPFLSGLGEIARNIGTNWSFDMLKVTRVTKDESILTTGMLLASPIVENLHFLFDWPKWFSFLCAIQTEYGSTDDVPYHNRTHASIHAHATTVLLNWLAHSDRATSLESLAILVASICHDVGHPGRTNAYLVNANKRLAIVYNDISVLENFHACKTFETMQQKHNNFISTITNDDYRYFRKVIVDLILATDMKAHFELVNSYKLHRNTPQFDLWADENKFASLKLVIKAADLSHGAFEWNIHHSLSMGVNEEFWAQGDAEVAMGLPKSPLCDRSVKISDLAQSQAGFLEFLVLPLYRELAAVDPSGNLRVICESKIQSNAEKWKGIAEENTLKDETPLLEQKSTPELK